MEEIRLRKSGLEMVDSSKLTEIKGGVSFGKFAEFAYKTYRIAVAVEKCLSSLSRRFRRY